MCRRSEVEADQPVDEADDCLEEGGQHAWGQAQQRKEDEDPVLVEEVDDPLPPGRQHDRQQPRAVQRRDRHQVEHAEHHVEAHQRLQQQQRELTAAPVQEDAQEKGAEQGEHEVGQRAGQADHGRARPLAAELVGAEVHRLAPAEARQHQRDAAERVQVGDGIEGQAPLRPRRAVALRGGDRGMAELVHGDGHHHREDERDERLRVVPQKEQGRTHARASGRCLTITGSALQRSAPSTRAPAAAAASCRRAATRPTTWPAETRSPLLTGSSTATAGSTRSCLRCRPAPSAVAARPTASASTVASQPSTGAATSRDTGAVGSSERSSTTRGSPPCAATKSRNRSSPSPRPSARRARSRPVCASGTTPASAASCPVNVKQRSSSRPRRSPRRTSTASRTSTALPTRSPSGGGMSLTTAAVRRPAAVPSSTQSRASSIAPVASFMNAPEPVLTSSRMQPAPPASFLLITLEAIRAVLATVAVTSRSA